MLIKESVPLDQQEQRVTELARTLRDKTWITLKATGKASLCSSTRRASSRASRPTGETRRRPEVFADSLQIGPLQIGK
jgi:hypothetical protein